MKKTLLTLSLLGLAGAAAFGVSSLVSGKTALEVKADSDPVTEIAMNADAFTNWDASWGSFEGTGATYWGGSFEALDTFFRGESAEGKTGTLSLKSWTQTTQYIYFQWGGAWADETHQEVYLHFHCVSTTLNKDGELIAEKGGDPFVYENDTRNDTHYENKMLLKYFEIPPEEYQSLGGANGFEMHIDLVDGRGANYGFHNFGYLHVNQTKEQVGDAMRYYLNHFNAGTSLAARQTIQGHYFTNAYLKNIFYASAADISDGFENNDDFLKHWYFDNNYYIDTNNVERHFDTIISDGTYRPGQDQLPFNKTGDRFFRGWYEPDLNSGFIQGDSARYRFLSRPFRVDKNNHFISIKMGGEASLHIIDPTVAPSDGQLAFSDRQVFNTTGDWRIWSGFNTCTMVRHVLNLEAYKGQVVQLAIADISTGGWGAAYFDELKVNFTPTSFKVDKIVQPTTVDGTFYSVYADRYAHPGLDTDSSDAKKAHDFLDSYYGLARKNSNGGSLCSVRTSSETQSLLTTYDALTEGVKAIVDASTDYDFGKNATSENWFRTEPTFGTVGASLTYLINENNQNSTNNAWFMGGSSASNGYIAITAILSAGAIAAIAFFLIKRRKSKAE